jgi:hypothetical protein
MRFFFSFFFFFFLKKGQKDKDKAPILLYTNGSKMGEEVIGGHCAISAQGRYTKARNISLRGKLEIMDAELAFGRYRGLR